MKIYFEDGQLDNNMSKKFDYVVDASDGMSVCLDKLDALISDEVENSCEYTVYTNFPLALDNKYAWNDKLGCEIFIRDDTGCYACVSLFTERKIRQEDNVLKLYLDGEFSNGIDWARVLERYWQCY